MVKVRLNKPNPILPIRMHNMLKEFEKLLLDNTLFKVQNQALRDKNPQWKEWWQIVHRGANPKQHGVSLSWWTCLSTWLQAYWTIFPKFKYGPPSFVSMEIGTSVIIITSPSVVQHVATTKLVSPFKGGMNLQIIPSLV